MKMNIEQIKNKIYSESLEYILVSIAYYLLDKQGFSPTRTALCLKHISEISESVRENDIKITEMKEELEKDYGVRIHRSFKGITVDTRSENDEADQENH